jgi:hypothetical protein
MVEANLRPHAHSDIGYRYLYEPEISRQVYGIHTYQSVARFELQALIVNLSSTQKSAVKQPIESCNFRQENFTDSRSR